MSVATQANHCKQQPQPQPLASALATTTTITTPKNTTSTTTRPWKVQASRLALNTSNPIREIIEEMNLAPNPNKKPIPLSIGDPTIFGNLKPCQEILDSLETAFTCGKYYGYQTAAGMESARDAVADYQYRCTGTKIRRQDVILTSGCSHALDMCICVLADKGQNILIPRPGFPLYKTLTSAYEVQYKQYNLLADENWAVDLEHLESLIDDNTAAIVINNPSNPCGSVFSKKHLLQILDVAERNRIPIISDEIYDKFVFAPENYQSNIRRKSTTTITSSQSRLNNLENEQPATNGLKRLNGSEDIKSNANEQHCDSCAQQQKLQQLNGVSTTNGGGDTIQYNHNKNYNTNNYHNDDQNNGGSQPNHDGEATSHYLPFIALSSLSKTVPILTCGGISKTCLIPGLRLGWIIVNDRQGIFEQGVRNGLSRLTQRLMGPNSLVQGALADILNTTPKDFYERTMYFIFQNAKLCYERLSKVQGLKPYMPQGSMYLMVRFDAKSFPSINGDLDFTSKLMNEQSVLVLPGQCFDFPNYFRVCLTVPTNVMEEALDRMVEFCKRHYSKSSASVDSSFANDSEINSKTGTTTNDKVLSSLNLSSANNINGNQANKCQ